MSDTLNNMKIQKLKNTQRIGSFNCQGLATSMVKLRTLADDFEKYNLNTLAIQETHIQGYGTKILKSSTNKEYLLYYSGSKETSENGVGIILPSHTKADFKPISDRLCQITIKLTNSQKIHILSAYAPTVDKSKKKPSIREKFYSELNNVVKMHKSRNITIVAGDFNAKKRCE